MEIDLSKKLSQYLLQLYSYVSFGFAGVQVVWFSQTLSFVGMQVVWFPQTLSFIGMQVIRFPKTLRENS